jgi:ACS family tartrate transporter-like MFS transporter
VAPNYDAWRSCFLFQGGLAVACGVLLFLVQPREIESCSFLSEEEKAVEREAVDGVGEKKASVEPPKAQEGGSKGLLEILALPTMWYFSVSWLVFSLPYWAFIYWVPKIVDEIENGDDDDNNDDGSEDAGGDVSKVKILFISSIPYTGAVLGNILIARSAEIIGKHSRLRFLALACSLTAIGFASAAVFTDKNVKILCLAIAGAGLWGNYGPMWSMVTQEALSTPDKGAFVAAVNGIGTIGGFIGPYAMACFDTREHSFWFFCGCALMSFVPFWMGCRISKSGLEELAGKR